jgi:hypothetical protein
VWFKEAVVEELNLDASQEALGKALDRAKMGEDKDLAGQVRDAGERLVRLLFGLIKLTEIHDLSNDAFVKPSEEFSNVMTTAYELLGAIHIVTVEDQVFLNDIRIRFGRGDAVLLSAALAPHQVGGLSFHKVPSAEEVRKISGLFAADPAEEAPRAALIEVFTKAGLDFVDLMGIYRFRVSGESVVIEKDSAQVSARAASLVDEAWDNLSADRNPNPLPLRRAVADILETSDEADVAGLVENPHSKNQYGDHALQVCKLSLFIAKEIGLSEENIQDLGVASMFHDMGYAYREGADPKSGEAGYAPPFERHGAAGARMLLKQRGFNQAKIHRALAALEHHRDYDQASGKPGLFARIIRIAEDFSNMSSRRGSGFTPHEALARMASGAGTRYDPVMMQAFVNLMGKYPPGTLLDVEIPLVIGTYTFVLMSSSLTRSVETFETPLCRLIQLPDGTDCPESYAGKVIDLAKRPHKILSVRSQI